MKAAQALLKKIVLHNKLASEAELDALLERHSHPEQVIRAMVTEGSLKSKVGNQLLDFYRKEVAKLPPEPEDEFNLAPEEEVKPRSVPGADDEVLALLLGNKKAASSESKPAPPPEKKPEPKPEPIQAEAPKPAAKPAPPPPPPKPKVEVAAVVPTTADQAALLKILRLARDAGASDVHLTAGLKPSMRHASRLEEMDYPVVSEEKLRPMLLSILTPEKRKHFEEHWDLDFCYEGGELGRFRANYLNEQNGTNGIFRLIPSKLPTFEGLKLPDIVRRFTEYRVGIVLVTGPKSCGKTSTLAAMVDHVNTNRKEHIITVEDPIEFVHPCKKGHVSQREVGNHTLSFSNALRSALREAPDVIMVGEMRDLETTSLAITAAETGHLVLATLHTPDAVRTISSVLDVFPPKEQGQIRSMLSESLRGIVTQQLIPRKDGGGLELALEILVNKPAIANLIREDRAFQIRGIMQTGRKEGMVLLDDSLLALFRAGKISEEEAMARATDEAYMTKELGGKKSAVDE